jgi:hypothetical protein
MKKMGVILTTVNRLCTNFFFETSSCYVAQAGLELPVTGVCHHVWLHMNFKERDNLDRSKDILVFSEVKKLMKQ